LGPIGRGDEHCYHSHGCIGLLLLYKIGHLIVLSHSLRDGRVPFGIKILAYKRYFDLSVKDVEGVVHHVLPSFFSHLDPIVE